MNLGCVRQPLLCSRSAASQVSHYPLALSKSNRHYPDSLYGVFMKEVRKINTTSVSRFINIYMNVGNTKKFYNLKRRK